MITDPIVHVKYWGHGILSPTLRGFSFIQRADPLLPQQGSPRDHCSTERLGPRAYTRSEIIGFRISLTLSHGAP